MDRNLPPTSVRKIGLDLSPSARGAWIATDYLQLRHHSGAASVALREGGVDRNIIRK